MRALAGGRQFSRCFRNSPSISHGAFGFPWSWDLQLGIRAPGLLSSLLGMHPVRAAGWVSSGRKWRSVGWARAPSSIASQAPPLTTRYSLLGLSLDKRQRLGCVASQLGRAPRVECDPDTTISPRPPGDPGGLGSVCLDCSLGSSPGHIALPFHLLSNISIQQSNPEASDSFSACLTGGANP